jgi:predicted methyltransferase
MMHMKRRSFLVALAFVFGALWVAPCLGQETWQEESNRLAKLLDWHAGSVVAEIGAGEGELTLLAAERVGPSGTVYTTELDAEKLKHLEELAAKGQNIRALRAGATDTNLPQGCCDSIFMRLVYHHLTKPAEIDASLFRALKPGGRLAVMDEEPSEGSSVPKGVPKNRVGHGIPQKILISELVAEGFQVESVDTDWPGRSFSSQLYCVVFHKPKP